MTYHPAVTVNSLPDNIFLEIFAFCLSSIPSDDMYTTKHAKKWQGLVQVCKRWQQIIYGSPRYLDLHLHCSNSRINGTPFLAPPEFKMLFRRNHSRWPEFPLTLEYTIYRNEIEDVDDLIAALEQPDRVHLIDLTITTSDSRADEVLQKMKVPFPALTHLKLIGPELPYEGDDHEGILLPRGFLGGSTPCLQHLHFNAVNATLFQELPSLLLSARGLISLRLEDIPDCFGYISPEEMVRGLAGLTKLRTLSINFRFFDEPPESNEGLEHNRRPGPPMCAVLPALTEFEFDGESAYLEYIAAQIDMPSVEDININYFLPGVEVHELSRFVGRTEHLGLAQFRRAQVNLHVDSAYSYIKLDHPQGERLQVRFKLGLQIWDLEGTPDLDELVTCMGRVLGQLTALLSNVDHLSFRAQRAWRESHDRLDDSKLLPFLHLFPAVEALHVSGVLAGYIATVLENIDEGRVTEVMPALRSLQLDGIMEAVGSPARFLSLRRLSGHPVVIVNTDMRFSSLSDQRPIGGI